MVENKCGQPGLWTLKLTVSQQRDDETNWFFACFYNFTQIKGWLKVFGVNMVKNRFGQSGEGTLKFTVSEEWTDGMYKLIFYMLMHDHQKLKADQKFFRWVWPVWSRDSKMSSWSKVIFSCWYEFRKAKSWFNYFWDAIVKNYHSFLVRESQIFVVP